MTYTVEGVDIVTYAETEENAERDTVKYFKDAGFDVQAKCKQLFGPAGGWPCMAVTFADRDTAIKGMTWYCDGSGSDVDCYI